MTQPTWKRSRRVGCSPMQTKTAFRSKTATCVTPAIRLRSLHRRLWPRCRQLSLASGSWSAIAAVGLRPFYVSYGDNCRLRCAKDYDAIGALHRILRHPPSRQLSPTNFHRRHVSSLCSISSAVSDNRCSLVSQLDIAATPQTKS